MRIEKEVCLQVTHAPIVLRSGILAPGLCCLLVVLVASGSHATAAAADVSKSTNGTFAQRSISPPSTARTGDRTMIYKIAGIAASTLVISFLCWFVAYPTILRKGRVWPVTLYGRCTAFAWCASWLIALWIFWDDLPIPGDYGFAKVNGLRCLFGVIAVFFAVVSVLIWRSPKQT